MCINTGKTKYMMFSRGQMRKRHSITARRQTIERVDTFCCLGIVFRQKTSQEATKHNIDQVKSRLHLFESLILPILLYV